MIGRLCKQIVAVSALSVPLVGSSAGIHIPSPPLSGEVPSRGARIVSQLEWPHQTVASTTPVVVLARAESAAWKRKSQPGEGHQGRGGCPWVC